MMNIPTDLKYAASHEWAHLEGEVVTVGISDFAQDQLGDVVFVELPQVGRRVKAGESVAVVESVKTASDIYAPVSGEITAVNRALLDAPEAINSAPYGEGWLFKIRLGNSAELAHLLDAESYRQVAAES
jgi:glycine cleavage system H protein